jgi:outer membrane protein OmpA-like peptidoglycan-associated protein
MTARQIAAILGGGIVAGSFMLARAQDDVPETPANVDLRDPKNAPLTLSAAVYPLTGEVRTLSGLGGGLAGGGRTLSANVEELKKAMADVGAQVSPIEIRVELPGDVLFDFDKATIKPPAEETLRKVATIIKARSKGAVRINGYTDSKGSDAYNLKLSDGRARSVQAWLMKSESLPAPSLVPKGFGEANPVAPNEKPSGADNPEGRAKNRRVEFIIPTR